MGVTGLWRLVEPAGKPVPVETLENKVLAVDISIWLHQMVKGYQDAKGAPLANAHLMGLFQRLCKLLYFRIKPVFVFDGGFPDLKRETIAKRQDSKAKYNSESERLKRELALLLSKKTAVSSLLGIQISPKKGNNVSDPNNDDIFKLPALPLTEQDIESESEDETSSGSIVDLHSVDLESNNFKTMPVKEKYDLLIELKETRKMNSWGKLHELPKKSDNFSDFQMERLLKRRKLQECLQETEKEMGDTGMSLNDLESLLNDEGIDTKIESLPTRRIASDNTTRILMINNVKQALAEAKLRQEAAEKQKEQTDGASREKKDELEEDIEKAVKMSLECNNEVNTSAGVLKTDESWTTTMTDSDYSDSEEDDGFEQPNLNCAKAYIMQYSDFTHKAINDMVASKTKSTTKSKVANLDKILEELNKEKSIILEKINLSSGDDDCAQEDKCTPEKQDKVHSSDTLEFSDEELNKEKSITRDEINLSSSDDDCAQEDKASDVTPEKQEKVNSSEAFNYSNADATQASVMCIENPEPDVITLDTSTESSEEIKVVEKTIDKPAVSNLEQDEESDSSEDEFEEVPEDEGLFKKPVVQLTFNIGSAPEDDIFADIFSSETENKTNVANIKEQSKFVSVDFKDTNKQNLKPNVIKCTDVLEQVIKENTIDKEISQTNQIKKTNVEIYSRTMEDFMRPSTSGIKISKNNSQVNSETNKLKPLEYADEIDDDLEKAIQMSLECVENHDSKIEESESNVQTALVVSSEPKKIILPPKEPITTEQLNTMAEEIQNEEQDLLQEKGRLDRIGRNITEQMTKEAQELLQIFGIPYIVAPMEAEAQCAFLESVNLTDGTITDDSDIWLFGGRTVYKNFFNQKKHVMQFQAERIERSFNLSREQLVLLALLVGSDYTTGVTGVGPVTALEILASFPFNKKQFLNETTKQARYAQIVAGLQEFKKWVRGGKRTDNTSLKKKLKNVNLTEDFPSVRVVQAYLEPNVEKSEDKFTWGELDITILRDYAKAKFGWSQNKLDEIIKPVLKRLLDRKSQRSVHDYFKRKIEFQSLEDQMSKRVKAAVQKMGPEGHLQENTENTVDKQKPTRKRKANKKKDANEEDSSSTSEPSKAKQKKTETPGTSNETEEEIVLNKKGITVVSQILDGKCNDITITKTDRFQEIIPQREKDKQSLLQNKLKAIEVFRKTKMDRTKKTTKKRVKRPKEKAELSESDSD